MRTDRPGGALPRTVLGLAQSCYVGNPVAAARAIIDRAVSGSGGYVCLCNVHVLTMSLHDARVHDALERAWVRLPDGAPIAWLQRRTGERRARRVGGPDLMPLVVDKGRRHGIRHFLYGSTPAVTSRVERALEARYPGVEIVGQHSPPFTAHPLVDLAGIERIEAARPHVVWCALGAPKQELYMRDASQMLPGVLLLGVGAAFHFVAGSKSRAPKVMRDAGLEWLHRLVSEPRRLGGRYVRTNAEFIVRSSVELARHRVLA